MRLGSALTILMLLGVALRLTAGWLRPSDLTADNDGYLAHAEMVVQGEGFAGPFTHQPTAFRPPAYPIALAVLRRAGLSAATSVAVVNGICGIALIWLTWQLGRQLGLPDGVTAFATTITTFDPLLLRYSILPMTEVPAAAVLLAAVVAMNAGESRLLSTGRVAEHGTGHESTIRVTRRRRTAWALLLLSGILFGFGSLVRPVILVCCGMLVMWRIIRSLKSRTELRTRILTAILPAFAALVAISPWIIRNAVQFYKFIPATTHGGYTLALGNNSDFYRDVIDGQIPFPWPGLQLDEWQQKMLLAAKADGVPVGNEPALDAWHYQQAFAAIRKQPRSFLRACLLRWQRFCAITPGAADSLPGIVTLLIAVWYGAIGMGVIVATAHALFGAYHCCTARPWECKSGAKGFADLWLIILSFMLLHSVYWTDTRMRAPVMPFVCLIAAFGLHVSCVYFSRPTVSKSPVEPSP